MIRKPTASAPRAAPSQIGGGCSAFLIPPFTVLSMSLLIFSMLSSVARPQSSPAPASTTQLAPLFTPEVQFWAADIHRWAGEWALPPNLVATVMQIESCGNPRAVSPADARGLFQVMPYHFAPGEDPFNPDTNARRGLAYLRRALDEFDSDVRLALAAYNGGLQGAQRAEASWADETRRYVIWGTGIWEDAQAGRAHSATLNEWLAHGGASLCRQARETLGLQP